MTERKRVLFILNSLAGGGAERVLLALLGASRDMLDTVDFSLILLDKEERDYQPPDWLRIHQLDCGLSLPRSLRGIYAVAKAEKPHVTVSFLTRANVASVIVAKLLGHNAVISERANTSSHFKPGLGGKIAKALIRLTYPRAQKVIAVSRGIAEDLTNNFGVPAANIATIANPVDAERIVAAGRETPEIVPEKPYVAVVSRLTKTKNVALVMEGLAASGIDMPLVILGQGPEKDALAEKAQALGLADRVVMPGFIANPYAVVANAAFYVSGSNAEGFPNGQVEALALGTPVVATNCASGPSEILDDARREDVNGLTRGRYGILVPTDDVDAMASAIRAVMEPDMQALYRAAGPERVKTYSLQAAKENYWNCILPLAKGRT